MDLQTPLKYSFPSKIRIAGLELYRQGLLRGLSGDAFSAEAEVLGSYHDEFEITREGEGVSGFCTCPTWEDRGVCKHLWALLLAAEAKGYLIGDGKRQAGWLYWADALDNLEIGMLEPEPAQQPRQVKRPPPKWKQLVEETRLGSTLYSCEPKWKAGTEVFYLIDVAGQRFVEHLHLAFGIREPLKNGGFGKLKSMGISRTALAGAFGDQDREILSLLGGAGSASSGYVDWDKLPEAVSMLPWLYPSLLPKICATGRCRLRRNWGAELKDTVLLAWDEGEPWRFVLRLKRVANGYDLEAAFHRNDDRTQIDQTDLVVRAGLLVAGGKVARLEPGVALNWVEPLRRQGAVTIGEGEIEEFLKHVQEKGVASAMEWPEELQFTTVEQAPQPALRLKKCQPYYRGNDQNLEGRLSFVYGEIVAPSTSRSDVLYDFGTRNCYRRNWEAEEAAERRLEELGLKKEGRYSPEDPWKLPMKLLPAVARELVLEGWRIDAEGLRYRNPVSVRAEMTSGIDWFELSGGIDFGSGEIPFPTLLKALEKGENWVTLADGSYGLLPQDLEKRFGLLLRIGEASGETLRYKATQSAMLDALLASREEIRIDERFAEVRSRLREFEGVRAAEQPAGFVGELRGYQREGLAWMSALRQLGLGGCLADDMGVGKTPQVLALLESRGGAAPSLVVAPRSLIHNWALEAERFTPAVRVLDLSGPQRSLDPEVWRQYDLLLATYGTLRRDAAVMQEFVFDTVVLDEAQAIKNMHSASAKAARLVRAEHRLALTGTPIENHLGELASLFEYLNPGVLGAWWKKSKGEASLRNPDPESRALLARVVRPYLLRRTIDQVASELPKKTEQTLYCELEGEQKNLYSELRDHYRASLFGLIEERGMARTKIQVLEALLRLRQAACHPALIDPKRAAQPSAKLETLLANIAEVVEEGHKALVFSQFVQFLTLVRSELDRAGIVYEYLDGQTRDRQERIERFQKDDKCRLFLISLKAGGFGLNLTAADYVFLLDPWWNPASEAQAVDRTHRIGQDKPVFAYRLIARDTVEERVLELQEKKRELADAILTQDNRVVSNLRREELELLLS